MEAAAGLVTLITAIVGLVTYLFQAHDAAVAVKAPEKKAEEIDHAFTTHDAMAEAIVIESISDRLQRLQIDEASRTGSPPRQ